MIPTTIPAEALRRIWARSYLHAVFGTAKHHPYQRLAPVKGEHKSATNAYNILERQWPANCDGSKIGL